MQTVAVFTLALICVFGVSLGQFGFPQQTAVGGGGGFGSGGLLALLGLLFLLFALFGSSSSGTGSTTIVYGNFSK